MDLPLNAKESKNQAELPVWLYIGLLLLVYGVLLLGAGLYQLSHPPHTVLFQVHATLWGGVLLFLLGTTYTVVFWPHAQRRSKHK
ncbi:MAG: hypothetical protein WB992_08060 [Bryobacteraceae bacterium]